MNARARFFDCLIVGAGLSGLVAATRLQGAGLSVLVIERASEVGGRMAPVRMDVGQDTLAVFDAGAQFFTIRDPFFDTMVGEWQNRGLVTEWSRGFATADGSFYADGHPRYRGLPDMGAITRDLATSLAVMLGRSVQLVSFDKNRWTLDLDNGRTLSAGALILTPPVPHSLALFDRGDLSLNESDRALLSRFNYEPCIALLIQLEGPGKIPQPGGMWSIGEPLAWLADNYRKGVSPVPGAITIHAGPEFSHDHWELDDTIVLGRLLKAVEPWLGSAVRASKVKRWQHSKPLWIHAKPFLARSEPAPLIFAGDAFAGPRVEGAALSGLAGADWLLGLNQRNR